MGLYPQEHTTLHSTVAAAFRCLSHTKTQRSIHPPASPPPVTTHQLIHQNSHREGQQFQDDHLSANCPDVLPGATIFKMTKTGGSRCLRQEAFVMSAQGPLFKTITTVSQRVPTYKTAWGVFGSL